MIRASWCGYCKQAYPKFIHAAKTAEIEGLNVGFCGMLETDDNEVPQLELFHQVMPDALPINGYPTFFYFAPGKKPVVYQGDHETKSMLEFVKKQN